MSGDVQSLNLRQERALSSLLLDGSPSRAAAVDAVSERTVRRWLDTAVFAAEFRRRAGRVADAAATDLMAAQQEAVQSLRDALASGSAATRVRAGRALLELGAALIAEDLDQRLTDLERRTDEWHRNDGLRLA